MRTSCIRLRAKSRIAVLYEDFLEICDGNMLAAMLLAILVYWTDVKIGKKESNLWIWKSHADYQEDLMFDKPGMKPPHRTTISSALDLLKAKNFIQWRKNPNVTLDRTRHYLVNQEVIQAAIDKLPAIESRKSDTPTSENQLSEEQATEADSESGANVGKPTMQRRKSNNALSEFQQSNVGKPTSNTSDYITVITDSVITEDALRATAPPSLEEIDDLTEQVEELIHITDKHKAVTAATLDEAAKGATNGQLNTSQPVVAVAAPTSPAASVSPPSSDRTAQRAALGRNHARAQPKPQLTLQGQQVRDWYEAIRGKVRLTDKNTIAFSNLGDEPEMSYDNLKDVLEAWDNDKWAKEHNMVPSPQELDSGYLSFEKGLQIVKRNRKMRAGNGAQSSEQFVSKTLDVERNEQRIQAMIEKSKRIREEREAKAQGVR